jgi:lipopolysaccharide biosynthesis glycosyltransferase/thioredoxin-like negative regulator of GroEL
LTHFEAAEALRPGNPSVQLEIASILRAMLRLDEAEATCRRILDQVPNHFGALINLGFLAQQRQDHVGALGYFETAAAIDQSNLDVQALIAHTLREMGRSGEAEVIYRRILEHKPGQVAALLGLGHLARQRAEWPAALAHFEAAAAANPGHPKPQLEIASTLRELLRVDEAEAILKRLEENPQAKTDSELQVRKLEHFCTTLQLEKAGECLAAWGGHRNIPSGGVALAAALYAARGQWHEVLQLFRERVVEGGWTPRMGGFDVLLEAVARAARATGRYGEVLTLLDCLPDAKSHQVVLNLRDQIIEEVRLRRSVDPLSASNGPVPDPVIGSPLRAWRADLLSRLLGQGSQAKPDRTIYFCTDRNYLPGAVVAMSSLLRHNMGALRNYSILVFCSDQIWDFASLAFGELAAAFSVRIDLRASTSLFPDGSGFRTGWGIFSPGHALSEAAYYRIYAALQLLDEGVEGRALYIDSDTCVGPNIDLLLEFDLRGQPLGARLEVPTVSGIRRAALKLGIRPEAYFNSGVLLFDLAHPNLATALRHAIDISLTQKHMLTFVDQCVLNLAFQDMVTTLPEPFNLFVRQATAVEALPTDPVVRHFIERPKPWDPMYRTANCTPWFDEFAALAQVLDPSLLRRLLALQFPVAPSATDQSSLG